MATVTEQMQHVLDRLTPVLSDPAAAPYVCLAALRLLHDALLPGLSPYGRSWYDTLVREITLTLISREDEGPEDQRAAEGGRSLGCARDDGRNGGEERG